MENKFLLVKIITFASFKILYNFLSFVIYNNFLSGGILEIITLDAFRTN